MAFIDDIMKRASQQKKTIVLAEGNDVRVLQAARAIEENGFARIILIGHRDSIQERGFFFQETLIAEPENAPMKEELAASLYELRKHKGMTLEEASQLVCDPLYFGTMLVKCGYADGMVAGACHATADVLRPALKIIKTAPTCKYVSSFNVMEMPEPTFGENGLFVFADCALEVAPDAEKLAHIGCAAAASFETMIGAQPRVAFLSHSTFGSAKNEQSALVRDACALAHQLNPSLMCEGEMQLDAALVPEVGALKAPGSQVAGKANVLVFPSLDAGNIGYKLVQRLGHANAYGPITQGLAAPINDLSRGCVANDIVGVVAITCVQAQNMANRA